MTHPTAADAPTSAGMYDYYLGGTAHTAADRVAAERIVFEPYTREMFEQTHAWMRTHALFDPAAAARPRYEEAVVG